MVTMMSSPSVVLLPGLYVVAAEKADEKQDDDNTDSYDHFPPVDSYSFLLMGW
jgi:hypothetical protein